MFLHDGLGATGSWRYFAPDLAAALGCGALVYSRAGYGASDPAPLPRPVEFMHDEALVVLPEILDQLEIRRAVLIGHSDGGSIALIHAAAFPDRVLALAIANGVSGPVETRILPACGHSPHHLQRNKTLRLMIDFLRKHLP